MDINEGDLMVACIISVILGLVICGGFTHSINDGVNSNFCKMNYRLTTEYNRCIDNGLYTNVELIKNKEVKLHG